MTEQEIGTHASHCCVLHGCKYGDKECPVVNGSAEQLYLCETCDEEGIKSLDTLKMAQIPPVELLSRFEKAVSTLEHAGGDRAWAQGERALMLTELHRRLAVED